MQEEMNMKLHLSESKLISYFYIIVHEAAGISKVRVLCVDIGQLNGNQVMHLKKDSIVRLGCE